MSVPVEEDGSVIFFRGLFGTGTAVHSRLPDLRFICEGAKGQVWLDWVRILGEEFARYEPTKAVPNVWIRDVQDILEKLASGPSGRNEPGVAAWLHSVRDQLTNAECGDMGNQLVVLNDLAYQTACELFANPRWASPATHKHWGTRSKLNIEHVYVSGASCFHPSTDVRSCST